MSLDGETVIDVEPIVGYLHRNHEKIGERNVYMQNMPFTDRLDYVTSMANNLAYALAVEKLMGIKPHRARRVHPGDHGRADPRHEPPGVLWLVAE